MKKIVYNDKIYTAGNGNFERMIPKLMEKPVVEVMDQIRTGSIKTVTGIDLRGIFLTSDGEWGFMFNDNGFDVVGIWRDETLYV